MIEVTYDGKYPNACSGTLTIVVDGIEIYSEQFCCSSSGSVWFDSDWDEHVECGKLTRKDANEFLPEIQAAVDEVLSRVHVCCGGCV